MCYTVFPHSSTMFQLPSTNCILFHYPQQHQHPYISAMINNGSLSYDHDRDGTLTQVAGCEAKFRNVDYDTHISIKYLNEKLTVLTDLENKHEWKTCFESPNVKLPTGYYFGASATTGDLSDNHDIISFKFYELEPIADVCIRSILLAELHQFNW